MKLPTEAEGVAPFVGHVGHVSVLQGIVPARRDGEVRGQALGPRSVPVQSARHRRHQCASHVAAGAAFRGRDVGGWSDPRTGLGVGRPNRCGAPARPGQFEAEKVGAMKFKVVKQ